MSTGSLLVTSPSSPGNVLGIKFGQDPNTSAVFGPVLFGPESAVGETTWAFPFVGTWGTVRVTSSQFSQGDLPSDPFCRGTMALTFNLNLDPVIFISPCVGFNNTQLRLVQQGSVFYLQSQQDGYLSFPTPTNPRGALVSTVAAATPLSMNTSNRVMEILTNTLAKADDSLCQGSQGSAAQICFFNHSPSDSTKPVYPDLYPGTVLGFNAYTLGSIPKLDSSVDLGYRPFKQGGAVKLGVNEQTFLGPPTNSGQTNNVQVSYSAEPDQGCHTQPDGPDTCAKQPGQVCIDGNLSCLPGYAAFQFLGCTPDKKFGGSYTGWQCLKPAFICDTKNQKCIERIDKTTPSQYDSMKDCIMDCEPCPAGYTKMTVHGVKGCFRSPMYTSDWYPGCHPTGDPCHSVAGSECNRNGAQLWQSCCHGTGPIGGLCHYDCVDRAAVPPYGFKCVPGGRNPCWQQCDSEKGCPVEPFHCEKGFNIQDDDPCTASTRFC